MAVQFPYKTNVHYDATVTDAAGAPVTTAVVTMTMVDKDDVVEAASGVVWPVTLTHQGAGVYRYTTTTALADALTLGKWRAQTTATIGVSQAYAAPAVIVMRDAD